MQLNRLTLNHFRVFDQAEFEFQPGMNLLVGINGAGKSTVLDALRIILSKILPLITASKNKPLFSGVDDITIDSDWLYTSIELQVADQQLGYEVREWREKYDTDNAKDGGVYDKVDRQEDIHRSRHIIEIPESINILQKDEPERFTQERVKYIEQQEDTLKRLKFATEQPLAVYFSTRRSIASMASVKKARTVGGQASAFAEGLISRELRVREFAHWWLVQEALARESTNALALNHLNSLQSAVLSFIDGCTNFRAIRNPEPTLVIDKTAKTLEVRQMSDGERSMLALTLDLARRLSVANPKLTDPLRDGKAVVLIDELDLHLHPRWQREIVDKLTRTFPNCQFIATTHSPQIVGEVSPDNIIMIEDGQAYRPDQSLGMDTNWILRHLMGVDERDAETTAELERIEALIEDEAYAEATAAIDTLRRAVGEFPELVGLQTRIDMIIFLSEQLDDEDINEEDSEDEE
ncbi:MAG TPA: AAA family ATPase [Caldilineaceae bacterium]|nr:AAA family ATPase [Caldilineaceae bacterium]